ncbi:MAG: YfhO family protein, partial [Oscillospiraceae bacterium]|nr:YfhO family protein [Oscillospiraceae bacterium]
TIIKEPFFYYFNRDVFQNDIVQLKNSPLEISKYKDNYIKGTVTAEEGKILFTSIPYEPGWTVNVDGKKVETTECLNAMIYVPLSAGTHTVTFHYVAPGFTAGVILFVIGIGMLVLFYRYDKKNNKVLLARARMRK